MFSLNDVAFLAAASAAAGPGFDFLDPANIGQPVEGGFFAGLISHTADGNPTHALIVAPAASGYSTTSLQWKTATTATLGTDSLFDGVLNTTAMVADGIANHPAAQFCVNLNVGGFSDWYMPSILEQDIAYFHLKPSTSTNHPTAGVNNYSVPKRTSAYSSANPPQTAIVAFQSGGPEAYSTAAHWTSTQNSGLNGTNMRILDGLTAAQAKNLGNRVRAFRKIAL